MSISMDISHWSSTLAIKLHRITAVATAQSSSTKAFFAFAPRRQVLHPEQQVFRTRHGRYTEVAWRSNVYLWAQLLYNARHCGRWCGTPPSEWIWQSQRRHEPRPSPTGPAASDDPHPRGVRAPPNVGPNLGASRSALRKTPAFVPIAHFHRGQTSIKDVSTTLLGLNIDF